MSERLAVRLTGWGVQFCELMIQRGDTLGVPLQVLHGISIQLKPLYEATGRSLIDLFDEHYTVADGKAILSKPIIVDEWPEVVGGP